SPEVRPSAHASGPLHGQMQEDPQSATNEDSRSATNGRDGANLQPHHVEPHAARPLVQTQATQNGRHILHTRLSGVDLQTRRRCVSAPPAPVQEADSGPTPRLDWKTSPGDQSFKGFRAPSFWQPFGRYDPGKVIGKGAQGQVYIARDLLTHEDFAVKVSYNVDPGRPQGHVLREVQALKGMRHANIMSMRAVLYDSEKVGLVFPLANADLKTAIALRKPGFLDTGLVKLYLKQLLQGLTHLHDKLRYVHLDLKPDNLLLNADHRLRIADFGLSRPIGRAGKQRSVVTMAYRAPEVFFRTPDFAPAIDMFAVGVILAEMMGELPWNQYASLWSPLVCFEDMLEYIGCGDGELWPGADQLPGVWHGEDVKGDSEYYLQKRGRMRFKPRPRRLPSGLSCGLDQGKDLIKLRDRLLVLNPPDRPSARFLLLTDPVFKNKPKVAEFKTLPAVPASY
ncbi:Cyclin-dependent kinase 2, partial [Tilletia horrida]